MATSCTWAPCLVDTVSSGRTGPWQDRGCRGEGHVLRVLHTVEAFYSEHHWEQGVCDLRVITHRQPHTSLFLILSETLSGQTTFPVPKFPLQSILPMVSITHTLLILALSTSLTPTLCTLSITSPSPSPSLSLASPHHTLRPAATLLTRDQCPPVGQPC